MITNTELNQMITEYTNSNECVFTLNRIMRHIANGNLTDKAKQTYNTWIKTFN
jgi:hypothetical protein